MVTKLNRKKNWFNKIIYAIRISNLTLKEGKYLEIEKLF